ncbi:MAG: nitrite reductase small subunit NirD [Thermoleophilaceae bacterium]
MSVALEKELVQVCRTGDVPLGEGRPVTVDGRRIAVFHTEAGWYALDDACPHRGGPLSDGILADRCVACPLHDRRFDLADGAALTDGEAVTAHRVVLQGDSVHVELTLALERAA